MKPADYYRHCDTLMRTGEVNFSNSNDTLEFMSIFLMGYYRNYLEVKYNASTNPTEKNDYDMRRSSEPMLVQNYVQFFLKEHLPDSSCWWYHLRRVFKPDPVLTIDTRSNKDLYVYVLERLGRTGDVAISDVFPNRVTFTIVGNFTVRINII